MFARWRRNGAVNLTRLRRSCRTRCSLSTRSGRPTILPDPLVPGSRLTKRRMADRLRRSGLRRQRETPLTREHETFPGTQANNPADAPERRALGLAINQLPIGQRQAIELLKLREMSLKEAAATTGMSIAALKVATHRALKALRKLLAGDEVR